MATNTGVFSQDSDTPIWPKDIDKGEYTITLYQPENASYIDNQLKSNLAFSVKKANDTPQFGMLWTTSLLDVDRSNRQATLVSVKIDEVRLSEEVSEENKQALENLINDEIPKWNIEFPLDNLLESLEEVSVYKDDFINKPPNILFAKEPTALIPIDGEPKFKSVEKNYELLENTGAFILHDTKKNTYYLRGGTFWYQSKSINGPWENVKKVPSKVANIAKKAEMKTEEQEESEGDDSDSDGSAPKILVATEPSELVVFQGEPKYTPLQNTNLLFVENTESDIFMNVSDQTYFLLISGRWFTTKDIQGKWDYLPSEELPEDFKNIPDDSKKAGVLSNVPGTLQAKNAIYDAQIPQTAAVNRDTKATDVVYNGTPEFKNIKGLKLQYAVNTESAVFKDKNTYFLCDNAVWFKSNTPNGPWVVADERPEEVSKIPAENPKYNTKYVYIYETSPQVVYVGYTPGYYGSYVYGPTVIYGTGHYYNPWYGGFYYHHHYTYGFSVRYNPWYGWSFGFGFGSPYGWYGHAYWGRGYHHWGPPYYRPPYYRRGYYRRPAHPIYNGRRGISHYNRPRTRPATRQPSRPATRPARRPSTQPATRPATRPSTRPSTQPTRRPSTQPTTRPATQPTRRPSTQPGYRSPSPNTRPSTRPTQPVRRTSARPTSRPTARPSGTMGARRSGRN
ncbi:hypothetical protein LVD13_01220 [Flavobacteriaceae bacterium D16]|nr:hypothetical protein [Flavobacteriaceae bacterium D16]